MATKRENKPPRDFVGSVRHALNVLRAFDGTYPQMTLSTVSERTGMTRAGARRYLLTLEHLGYIHRDDRLFRLTAKVLDLGFAFLSTMPLSDLARPYLRLITKETGEIAALAILDGSDIIHIAGSTVERVLAPTLTIGRRFSALYASSGRVVAAFMDPAATESLLKSTELIALTPHSLRTKEEIRGELRQVQRQGYAIVDQEVEVGIRSIAVPVLGAHGVPLAAVTVLTNVATVSKKQLLDQILPVLQRIVPQIPLQAT
ncbi:MAG TPA: IclR family transcriptional regulator C-terminal domain-containing protein [Steroidobacteraceae bacterium]|jgi:IclR family pca regulon transcriptional regulator